MNLAPTSRQLFRVYMIINPTRDILQVVAASEGRAVSIHSTVPPISNSQRPVDFIHEELPVDRRAVQDIAFLVDPKIVNAHIPSRPFKEQN